MNKALIFHADPAHGWLEVNRADLEALNIAHKISRCSYQKADRVFLEEDSDAAHYLRAAGGRDGISPPPKNIQMPIHSFATFHALKQGFNHDTN